MRRLISLTGVFALLVVSGPLSAQPFAIPQGAKCDECGMSVEQDSKFVSEVLSTDGKKLFFCDVGDMLFHFRKEREKIKAVYVKDYGTGEWIDGKKAFFILNKGIKTPMSWGIVAFARHSEAEAKKRGTPVDFSSAFTLTQ
jgi:nitrous oxide reductase accessory protein NosL